MAQLSFDQDEGCYAGRRLSISGRAMLHRIRLLTEANHRAGADLAEAAEAAWHSALEEESWQAGEEGVTLRSVADSASNDGSEDA